MTNRKPFDTAFAEFKAAEKEVIRLSEMHEQAASNLLDAKIKAAAADREAESFGSSGKVTDINAANELAARRLQANNLAQLLENSIDHIAGEVRAAKARLILAERACHDQQCKFYDAEFSRMLDEFLRTNRAPLQRLVETMHADSVLAATRAAGDNGESGRLGAYGHLKALFEHAMPVAVDRFLAQDTGFHDNVGKTSKGQVPVEPMQSEVLTSEERGRTRGNRNASAQAIAQLLMPVETPEQPATPGHVYVDATKEAEQLLAAARRSLEEAEEKHRKFASPTSAERLQFCKELVEKREQYVKNARANFEAAQLSAAA